MIKMYDMQERAELYNSEFPDYPPLVYYNDYIYGIWKIGNDYRNNSSYYGAYPHSYLKRILSMFPDIEENKILHLFSGSLSYNSNFTTFDINKELKPKVVGDAENLSGYFNKNSFELILADPPYSEEDAVHYGTSMINRNKVLSEAHKVLCDGGYIVWLDQVLPMYKNTELKLVGEIGLIRSTNHRVRAVFIWRKLKEEKTAEKIDWFFK